MRQYCIIVLLRAGRLRSPAKNIKNRDMQFLYN